MIKTTLSALSLVVLSSSAIAADAAQLEQGKTLFTSSAQPIACSVCHTLKDADAVGTIGPDLDELKPDADRIRKTMMEGMGAMPSFAALDEGDREAIITYVVEVTK